MSTIQLTPSMIVGRSTPAGFMPGTNAITKWLPFGRYSSRMFAALMLLVSNNALRAQEASDEPMPSAVKRTTTEDRSYEAVKIRSNSVSVDLTERFSKDLDFSERITRVDGHDPEVINVVPLGPSGLRIRGIAQGVTTMIVTGASNQKYAIEVYVSGDARLLQSVLKRAFPDSAITCRALQGDAILLTGYVTDNQTISQIMDVARVYAPNIINHIRVGGAQEIQLRVKILEVQRSKLRTFGIDLQAITNNAVIASSPIGLSPLQSLTLSGGGGNPPQATNLFPNTASFFLSANNNNFGIFDAFITALKTEGLLKVMTEPVLVTRGGEAGMLTDGGQFPVPIPAGLGTVGIQFRQFGVILETLPTVISPTRLKLQVSAEVSDKDLSNAITLNGTTVPGITNRSVQSTVEMNIGDTMVVAGLISTRVYATYIKTPLIGEFPLIGALFSKKSMQESETELVILLTPEFGASMTPGQVPSGGPGMQTTSPTDREMYGAGLIEVPKFGPGCPPNFTNECFPSGSGLPNGPMITPGPAMPQSPGGLIMPSNSTPQGTIPPAPSTDPSVSRRQFSGSSWPTKSKSIVSKKTKDSASSPDSKAIQPAGFRKQTASSRYSDSESKEKNHDDNE